MKAFHFPAAVAAALVLASCGGGGSGSPVASAPQTPTLDRAQGASPGMSRAVGFEAANNLPRFGSVTQSSNAGAVDDITTDAASTSFDGTDLRVTITRQDGSRFVLDSATDTIASIPNSFAPGLSGFVTRTDGLLDHTSRTVTIAATSVIWDETDESDYLAGGYWLHITGTDNFLLAGGRVTGVEVGAFVDGPELSGAAPDIPASGTATYEGLAAGFYVGVYGRDAEVPVGSSEIGEFEATIRLTANFNTDRISGCVGCNGPITAYGIFTDSRTGEQRAFAVDSDWEIHLGPAPIGSDGSFRNQEVEVRYPGPEVTVVRSSGSWGGKFSNVQDASGDPRLVAGTAGGEAETSGGSRLGFVGAWYGTSR